MKGVIMCMNLDGKEGEGAVDSVMDDVTVEGIMVEGNAWGGEDRWVSCGCVLGRKLEGYDYELVGVVKGYEGVFQKVHVRRKGRWLAGMKM